MWKIKAFADDAKHEQKLEMDVIVAERVKRCLLSGTRLRSRGIKLTLVDKGSYIEKDGNRVPL